MHPPMQAGGGAGEATVELYLRALCQGDCRSHLEDVVARVEDLVAAGAVDSYEIHLTGGTVPTRGVTADTDTGRLLRERFAAFEGWAEREDRCLADAFCRRETTSAITGEDHSGLVFPTLALVERVDGEIEFVSPSVGDDDLTSVEDRLDAMAGREAGLAPPGIADAAPDA